MSLNPAEPLLSRPTDGIYLGQHSIGSITADLADVIEGSVDHDLGLEADHRLRRAQSSRPRLGRWIVIQREQFVIY